MLSLAGVSLVLVISALVTVYVLGYVVGVLLLSPRDGRPGMALGVVRLVSGLLLSTTTFMLSLAVHLPWWVGPAILVLAALAWSRSDALSAPRWPSLTGWDHIMAAVVALVILSPVLLASLRMGYGPYPPVFLNVDSPYFLEKVRALVHTEELPPLSLGVLGGRYVYHYGAHAAAALVSRVSQLPPHQALFLILIPVLTAGIYAAAVVAVEVLSPNVPRLIAVPLLLIAAPSLWYPFWLTVAPRLQDAVASVSFAPLSSLASDYELWGVAGVAGQNLASQFIILAVIGGVLAASSRGWRHPAFLIGSAILFKAQTGVALAGGFAAMEIWEALRTRSIRPLVRVAAVASVFAVVYSALWTLPGLPQSYSTELHPFFHLSYLADRGWVSGYVADVAWLIAPVLFLLPAGRVATKRSRLSLLILAVTPLVIVNVLRARDLRPGMGFDEDWLQIAIVAPLLMHAFVLAFADSRWTVSSTARKVAFACAIALSVVPPVLAAGQYARVLVSHPEKGHEYVDNHALASALGAIPVQGSLVVTNDLRYPAGGFIRTNRQMQIPALFGHQAFAVNYAYEIYDFSAGRLALQQLLQAPDWSPAVDEAARRYGWTHLLVRKDFSHPAQIPLPQVYDGPDYAVYRFPAGDLSDVEAEH